MTRLHSLHLKHYIHDDNQKLMTDFVIECNSPQDENSDREPTLLRLVVSDCIQRIFHTQLIDLWCLLPSRLKSFVPFLRLVSGWRQSSDQYRRYRWDQKIPKRLKGDPLWRHALGKRHFDRAFLYFPCLIPQKHEMNHDHCRRSVNQNLHPNLTSRKVDRHARMQSFLRRDQTHPVKTYY